MVTDLQFRWSPTWPDAAAARDDFVVSKDQLGDPTEVLRILKVTGGPQDSAWSWSAARLLPPAEDGLRRYDSRTGYAETARAAATEAEAAWFGRTDEGAA